MVTELQLFYDMNFRGFWLGTSRVFANALYFGDKVRAPQKTKDEKEEKEVKP